MATFFEGLKNSKVKVLDLSEATLGDKSWQAIGEVLENTEITYLRLPCNDLNAGAFNAQRLAMLEALSKKVAALQSSTRTLSVDIFDGSENIDLKSFVTRYQQKGESVKHEKTASELSSFYEKANREAGFLDSAIYEVADGPNKANEIRFALVQALKKIEKDKGGDALGEALDECSKEGGIARVINQYENEQKPSETQQLAAAASSPEKASTSTAPKV